MSESRIIAAYLPEFLKRDMMHVYRQISALPQTICHVFTHKRENEDFFPYHNRRLHVLPKPRLRWWRRWVNLTVKKRPWQMFDWELRHWMLELTRVDASLLHVYFGHIAPQFIPLMRVWPHPVVVSFHGADAGVNMDKPGHLRAMQEVFTLAAGVLCRSQSLADDLVALGCPKEKTFIWRTGLPLDKWVFTPRARPEDGAWKLIQVCRFVEKKGLDLTLDAFAQIRADYPKARLILIGDGPCLEALKQQAARLGMTDAVEFRGFLRPGQVKRALYESHVFVHPSRTSADGNREGIPNAALEAMASGMPVVGTMHGGYPEAITDGVSGVLVPENRVDLLAEGIRSLIGSPALVEKMIQEARRTVESQFDRDKQVLVLEGHYEELIEKSRR